MMYFVCDQCDAKWFAEINVMPCPRCGSLRGSREEIEPPWRAKATMFTVAEVAKKLRVSAGLIYRLVERKEMQSYKIGGAIRVSEDHLREYLEGCSGVMKPSGYRHVKRLG